MSLAQANKEKTKVKLAAGEAGSEDSIKLLPEHLCGLIARSKALQADIRRLDATMHARPPLRSPTQQSGRAAARPAQGRVRAGRTMISFRALARTRHRRWAAAIPSSGSRRTSSGTATTGRRDRAMLLVRRSRPGCDFGSMSRRSVSPGLPQVVRVVNSVPSVITTFTHDSRDGYRVSCVLTSRAAWPALKFWLIAEKLAALYLQAGGETRRGRDCHGWAERALSRRAASGARVPRPADVDRRQDRIGRSHATSGAP